MDARAARILLVEDDRFLRRAAEASLKRKGFTVSVAVDGEDAVRQAAADPPDVILLDLILPKLPGFEVLRALKSNPATAGVPVIVLSNLGQDGDVKQAMDLGAVSYFVKANLSLDEMAKQVEQTLARSHSK